MLFVQYEVDVILKSTAMKQFHVKTEKYSVLHMKFYIN